MTLRSRWVRVCLILLAFWGLLYAAREKVLWALGQALVVTEEPFKADAVLVIGGDASGNRIVKGAQLVRDGWAPTVFVSGAAGQYGFHETTLAIEYVVKKGYDRQTIQAIPYAALSTTDEANYDVDVLRKHGVRRYILVTSFSHTRRARGVFRRTGPDLEFRTVASTELHWANGRWWTDREGRKIWFFATIKAIADYFGI